MIRPSLTTVMILKLTFPFLISFYFILVESVPEDYCLSPLNTSDCGRPPTPVFYYYKPGSRCEIKVWRGCPTENLFKNEYQCSHHCIGKLWSSELEAKPIPKASEINSPMVLKHRCDVPIDTSKCKQAKQFVYTYDIEKKKCTEVTYYGCPSENKYMDKDECEEFCEKSEKLWEHDVNNLDLDDLKKLNDMLDEVNEPEKEQLNQKVVHPKIRPHTVSNDVDVTDQPVDETTKVEKEETTDMPEKPTDKPDEPTNKPEEPTDKPEELTDKPKETTIAEENETKQVETTAASADSTLTTGAPVETTTLLVSTKRTRRRRPTKKIKEGDVVREGLTKDYK